MTDREIILSATASGNDDEPNERQRMSDGNGDANDREREIYKERLEQAAKPPEPRIETRGGQVVDQRGLTEREERYCQARLKGLSKAKAYREAYGSKDASDSYAASLAYRVEARSAVRGRLTYLNAALTDRTLHEAAQARTFLMDRLIEEATDSTNRASDRLRALELLGKMQHVAAFADISHSTQLNVNDPAVIRDRIDALLSRLGAK